MLALGAYLSLVLVHSLAVRALPSRISERAQVIDRVENLEQTYDYVIIGGGTSGLTVADRLTEDPSTTVLVVEYGYVDGQEPGVLVPGLRVPDSYLRNYYSVPQPGLNGRSSIVYSGAVVGGGTVVNGMIFNRGSAADYDAWEALGNPGWGWSGLLPYFKKSENFSPPPTDIAREFAVSGSLDPHGTNGPIDAGFSNYQYPIVDNWYRAWSSVGVNLNSQPSAGNPNGAIYSPLHINAQEQTRFTAASGHFRPVFGQRSNYHLITAQNVLKINFDASKTATSVSFADRATKVNTTVTAKREVILAAGAVHSPQILQLSGVGPTKLLQSQGIQTVVDLPGVGYNFHDQPSTTLTFDYHNYPGPYPDWLDQRSDYASQQLNRYYENRTGPYTIPYGSGSIITYLPLKDITDDTAGFIARARGQDLASLLPSGANGEILNGYRQQINLALNLFADPTSSVHETAFISGPRVPITAIKPLSRGTIQINSADPFAPPVVDYNTFKHPADLDIAALSVRKVRQVMASSPMTQEGIATYETTAGANNGDDYEAIKNFIRGAAVSTWAHPVGTCAMMPRDMGGVLDSNLNVYGVQRLRVVDASMMPMIPGGHTSTTVYAVAEKAADLIKGASAGEGVASGLYLSD